MARVPIIIGLAAVIAILVADGRIETLIDALSGVDIEALQNADFESPSDLEAVLMEAIPPELQSAVLDLFSAEIIALVGSAAVLSFLIGIFVDGLSNAAAINGIYGCLYANDGVEDAVVGVGRDWRSFVGISVAQVGLAVVGLVPVALGVSLFTVSTAAGVAATFVGVLLSAGIIVVGLLALAFAGQSVVVDGVGVRTAIRRSAGFPIRQPRTFLAYILVTLGVFGGLGVLGGGLGALGVSQLAGIFSSLVAVPFLDAFKTTVYADRPFDSLVSSDDGHRSVDAEALDDREPRVDGGDRSGSTDNSLSAADQPATHHRLIAAFRDGLNALGGFTRSHPGSILLAAVLFSAAAVGGWQLTTAYSLNLPLTENVGEVFGTVPINTFVALAANNWLVSATAAYSGVALGVPTAVDMLLNGFVVGALAGVIEPLAFAALVAPHGVIELPAIAIAGGLGFHLAAVVAGVLRDSRTSTELVESLRLVYRVLLGLAVILVVAAFIEAFLTPLIADVILT